LKRESVNKEHARVEIPSEIPSETSSQRESIQPPDDRLSEVSLSNPLTTAILEGSGYTQSQAQNLSPLNYAKLQGTIARLKRDEVTPAQVKQAASDWWGDYPPNFDQLADESLKVKNGHGKTNKQSNGGNYAKTNPGRNSASDTAIAHVRRNILGSKV
jgi:hypothetical protein